jgi:hypothetical protein
MSAITEIEARTSLFGLIQQVNDDHTVVEVVSRILERGSCCRKTTTTR